MDEYIANYLRTLPGFPTQLLDGLQQARGPAVQPGNTPGPANPDLYGNPSTYTYTPPAPATYSNLIVRERYGDTGSIAAADTRANIIKEQFNDYMNRFAPVEDRLVNEVMNQGAGLNLDMARTQNAITGAAINVQGQAARDRQRLGLSGSADPNVGNNLVSDLVGGLRDTRMRARDRRDRLMSGTANTAVGAKRDFGGLS